MPWYGRVGRFSVSLLVAAVALAASDNQRADWDANARLLERWKADPQHYARLQLDLQRFKAMPLARQLELRQLDLELHSGDAAQRHLLGVLERYALWLERLPEADKKKFEAPLEQAERLRLIGKFKEKEWLEHLPENDRIEVKRLRPEDQWKRAFELWKAEMLKRQPWHHPGGRPGKEH